MYFEITYLKNGQKHNIIIQSDNFLEASKKFKAMNVGVFIKATPTSEPFSKKVEKIKKKLQKFSEPSKIDQEEYISVLEQIYVMLDASLSLNDILENISENIKDKKLKQILIHLNKDVQSGINISDSLKRYEKEVGKLSVAMIELGEQTGMLAESFRDLAEILREITDNRKKLKSATRYPVFILFAMSVAFTIVILFVIPPFKNVFADLGATLPLPTRFLLWLENFIKTFGGWILGLSLLMMVTTNYLYEKYSSIRLFIDKIMLRVYIVGAVIKYAMLGRFLYSFDKMVEAGIPIIDALDTSLGIVDNLYIKTQLSKIKNSITEGRGLASGFEDATLFDKMIIQMIKSGEESGALNKMLNKASKYYKEKYLDIVENISTLIEPILITAIAGFVLVLAFGIFLPMWGMADAIKGK